ncbi:MAG: fibronectin type III domain-containing protein [Prevotellaceae bacterium]|nr:fibronectin type III domain-containing protein [Prevotellaceae bacterium]
MKARITLSDNFNVIYGFCWSDHPRPVMPIMIEDKVESAGRGVIEADITNLEAGTQYYVRAYAVMLSGTVYGNEISFTTADATDPY